MRDWSRMAEPKPAVPLAKSAASKARAASRAAAFLGLAASSTVMAGWLLDILDLRTILPGEAPRSPRSLISSCYNSASAADRDLRRLSARRGRLG